MPTCCAANEITVVVPPNAAAVVALSNVSAFIRPEADSCWMWQWLSTPPGSTSLPRASISRLALVEALGDRRDRRAADADVGLEGVGCGRDRAAADHEIEGLHRSLRHGYVSSCPALCRASTSLHCYPR